MSKPAFLVDGHLEKFVIESICPGNPVRLINCNGDSVSLEAIAERIDTLVRLFNNRRYPIIAILDRENRSESVRTIADRISQKLDELECPQKVFLGIADRTIENWFLADPQIARKLQCTEAMEGRHGKREIKKLMPDYHETTDGVRFFLDANPSHLCSRSQSFRQFVDTVRQCSLICSWLDGVANGV